MGKLATSEQNNKHSNWANDYGEMRRNGENAERKSFIITL